MTDLFGNKNLVRVVDFEGTALDETAKVIEVGWWDFSPSDHLVLTGGGYLCGGPTIPPESRAVHHIRQEDIADKESFDAAKLEADAKAAGVVAWAAYNAEYEQRFLADGIPLVCVYKAALRCWPDAPSHGCMAVLYWLEDQGKVEYDRALAYPPHRATPDAYATAIILKAIYALGHTGKDLIQWTSEPRLLPRCPIGVWRGKPWADVDDGFLRWILSKGDMDADIQWNADRELTRREEEYQ